LDSIFVQAYNKIPKFQWGLNWGSFRGGTRRNAVPSV